MTFTHRSKLAEAYVSFGLDVCDRYWRIEKAFWTNIYTKLLPLLVAGDKDSRLSVIHRIERIIVEHHTLANNGRLRFGAVGSAVFLPCPASALRWFQRGAVFFRSRASPLKD